MINPHRSTTAYEQGAEACRRTRGIPKLTVCPYYLWTSQNKAFSKGWNDVWKVGHKFWAKAHTATKIA